MTDDIKALVEATLQAKIVQAFHDAPEAIDKLVQAALGVKVNENGGRPDGYGRREMPYLEWLVGDTIRRVARGAVETAVKQREEDIRATVASRLSSDAVVDSLVKKIVGVTTDDWRINVTFADESKN
jgi:hypothetical protein